ncbi:MAG: hypothetical protein ACE5HB_06610 [Terriglobia bacterium]
MPDSRVQLAVEIETEGTERLTTLKRELEQLGAGGAQSFTQLDASLVAVLDRLKQSRQLVGATTREFLQSHRRLFTSLEPVFQNFFRRILGGARSFRDSFKRLLADLLGLFLRTVSQMVAAWLGGFRLLGGGGGAAGGLGSLLPLISSGFGFQSGLGGTPPFFPGAGGGGASATNLGLLSNLGINLRGLNVLGLTIPGAALASGGLLGLGLGFTQGSRTLGALGGAAAGFAFGGPLGALVGGIAGFFTGLFGRGRRKRRAARAEAALFTQLQQTVEEFKRFRLDFESALAQFDALWADFQASAPRAVGSAGRRAVRNVAPTVGILRTHLLEVQRARERRQGVLDLLPIPEFRQGGFVDTVLSQLRAIHSGQGKLLAFLHPGEAVLTAAAVQRLGPQFINQVNRAPAFQAGGLVSQSGSAPLGGAAINLTINITPSPGMDEEQLAAFTLRALKRELEDRGLNLG